MNTNWKANHRYAERMQTISHSWYMWFEMINHTITRLVVLKRWRKNPSTTNHMSNYMYERLFNFCVLCIFFTQLICLFHNIFFCAMGSMDTTKFLLVTRVCYIHWHANTHTCIHIFKYRRDTCVSRKSIVRIRNI